MAAISKVLPIGNSFTKLFANHSSGVGRRAAYCSSSLYDKNVDDQVRPTVVPDHVIESGSSSYWGPHPKTGVFGPADRECGGGHRLPVVSSPSSWNGGGGSNSSSVLDRTVWFRSGEEEEPPY